VGGAEPVGAGAQQAEWASTSRKTRPRGRKAPCGAAGRSGTRMAEQLATQALNQRRTPRRACNRLVRPALLRPMRSGCTWRARHSRCSWCTRSRWWVLATDKAFLGSSKNMVWSAFLAGQVQPDSWPRSLSFSAITRSGVILTSSMPGASRQAHRRSGISLGNDPEPLVRVAWACYHASKQGPRRLAPVGETAARPRSRQDTARWWRRMNA
jgi:hypothetical protein